jgi:predicted Zn-dependent protease
MRKVITNSLCKLFSCSVSGILVLFTVIYSLPVRAQEEGNLIKDLMKTADILNETLLEVTALTDAEENAIGEELDKQISNDLRFTKERKFNVNKIFNNLMRHIERTEINYNYKVAQSDEVNAYAIAGGNMYVNTGILDFLDDEDEIAFVVAHELSHNELRHCIKRVQYAVLASSIDPSLGEIVQVAYSIYSMPFSKYDEFEADENGVMLMLKAGYKKSGAVSFFEKLEELEKEYGMDQRDAMNDFISSHPTARERRNRVINIY